MAEQQPRPETASKKETQTKPETVNLSPKELADEELKAISGGTGGGGTAKANIHDFQGKRDLN